MKQVAVFIIAALLFSFRTSKNKEFIPPGTVKITDTLFADECEVSNWSWQEYEIWTKNYYGNLSKEHLASIPDTTVWISEWGSMPLYMQMYYRHPAFTHCPVIGITYEQAQAFCKWRTERVKQFYALRYKKNISLQYRLPTKTEWENLNTVGNLLPLIDYRKKKFNYKLRVSKSDTIKVNFHNTFNLIAPCESYAKNNFGLFNTIGNVAEMTAEKGICKGGGWIHNLDQSLPGKDMAYNGAQCWLGFRCVCVLSDEK